jgi:hypothetical protein
MRSPSSLYVCVSHLNRMLEPILNEILYVHHGTWAHFNGVLHKSLSSVCVSVCVSTRIVSRQRLGKHIPVATNKRKREELLDSSFSMQSVSYQRKVGDHFFPELLVYFVISKCNSRFISLRIKASTSRIRKQSVPDKRVLHGDSGLQN